MIVITDERGHVAVTQPEHARMCAQLGRHWGNDRFGSVEPAAEVELAADQHEGGMAAWDAEPSLDAAGLPATVMTMDFGTHLERQLEAAEMLEERSPYAALLVSLKHAVMYEQPRTVGLVRRRGRQINSFLRRSAEFQRRVRGELEIPASDRELERNWRLVRTWDALSHNLLIGRIPSIRRDVPAAGEQRVDIELARRGGQLRLDPWPFAEQRLVCGAEGRLLERSFDDEREMRAALAAAAPVRLDYELVPA